MAYAARAEARDVSNNATGAIITYRRRRLGYEHEGLCVDWHASYFAVNCYLITAVKKFWRTVIISAALIKLVLGFEAGIGILNECVTARDYNK